MRYERFHDNIDELKSAAQADAEQRYVIRADDIENIRQQIRKVRDGLIPLLDLEENAKRKRQRVERENAPLEVAIERINGEADFLDVGILDRLAKLKGAVCRISLQGRGIGTGFLIADGVIITNHHVIPNANAGGTMMADFGYELNEKKELSKGCSVRLRPDLLFITSSVYKDPNVPSSGLDFTVIGLDAHDLVGDREGCCFRIAPLDGSLGKIITGEQCVTIQHPAGEPKKVVLKDISLLKLTETHLIYESDTLPGSSGSMVVGLGTGEVIALHHAGVPRRDEQGKVLTKSGSRATPQTPDEQIDWLGNEGIRISCIIAAVEGAQISNEMQPYRERVLAHTRAMKSGSDPGPVKDSSSKNTPAQQAPRPPVQTPAPSLTTAGSTGSHEQVFILLVRNTERSISAVNAFLSARYGRERLRIELMTPLSARAGADELFQIPLPVTGDANDEANQLMRYPGILAAEADAPIYLNTGDAATAAAVRQGGYTESAVKDKVWEDEFAEWNEAAFLKRWVNDSPYFNAASPLDAVRRWNHAVTRYDKLLPTDYAALDAANIVVGQLDTGYTLHQKVAGGFDLDSDFDAVAGDNDALDELQGGVMKMPGHGTRTGALLIGRVGPGGTGADYHEGEGGFLTRGATKLIPFRIAETVILLNRQEELARAVDRAIASGVQVLTMSMGTAPTITTARLAKKAYDAGVIWCCAAGNEVKFVIAPAVFPGTIAVAASNPADRAWAKSSEGDAVDITAPGEDVLVPIFTQQNGGRGEDYAYGDGTSYATPHAAGAAALWLAKYKAELAGKKGWQRVEGFRKAMKATARTEHRLPKGYGAGILDVQALLNSPKGNPSTKGFWNDVQYAYNGWNEKAFLASLQGWTELMKTYWNIAHSGIRRLFRFGESMEAAEVFTGRLSDFARTQEALLFGPAAALESTADISPEEAARRLQTLNNLMLQSATENPDDYQ